MRKQDPHYFGHRKRLRDRFLKSGLGPYEARLAWGKVFFFHDSPRFQIPSGTFGFIEEFHQNRQPFEESVWHAAGFGGRIAPSEEHGGDDPADHPCCETSKGAGSVAHTIVHRGNQPALLWVLFPGWSVNSTSFRG